MISADQLKNLIIKPALQDLQMFSLDAMELLIFTCAVESKGGFYLKQLSGPALGIFQMEPATYNDIWQNFIMFKSDIKLQLLHNFNAPVMPSEDRMIYDLRFAAAMCRLHYERVPEALPNNQNPADIWNYYKKYYNTIYGAASYDEAIKSYDNFRVT